MPASFSSCWRELRRRIVREERHLCLSKGGSALCTGFEKTKMTTSSSPMATTSRPAKEQCPIDGDGDNSFSFASTALALSCEELPPSPCLRSVRGSKVRARIENVWGAWRLNKGVLWAEEPRTSERAPTSTMRPFSPFFENRPSTSSQSGFFLTKNIFAALTLPPREGCRGRQRHRGRRRDAEQEAGQVLTRRSRSSSRRRHDSGCCCCSQCYCCWSCRSRAGALQPPPRQVPRRFRMRRRRRHRLDPHR